ncbi:hypothetical protein GCM10027214_04350 [Stenotrophomonas tumulicola]
METARKPLWGQLKRHHGVVADLPGAIPRLESLPLRCLGFLLLLLGYLYGQALGFIPADGPQQTVIGGLREKRV